MILLYLIVCGAITTSHVAFKLVVGRLYEVEMVFGVITGTGFFIAASSIIFYSACPMTHKQFKKRLILHANLFLFGSVILYATDIFQFLEAANPVLERCISFIIICIGYAVIAFLLIQSDKNRIVTQEMNDALQRYQSRKSNRKNTGEEKL